MSGEDVVERTASASSSSSASAGSTKQESHEPTMDAMGTTDVVDASDSREQDKTSQEEIEEGENSEVNDCQSDAALSVLSPVGSLSQEEFSLVLQASPGYKKAQKSQKSPIRGMLRAVSSITITDIEAFEEGVATLRGTPAPVVAVRKVSPITSDVNASTHASAHSQSHSRSPIDADVLSVQKPRRTSTHSRRRRDQREECWFSDDDDDFVDEIRLPVRPPFASEERGCRTKLKRRKSIDLLPNVPRRAPSTQDLEHEHDRKNCRQEDSEMEKLMKTLHDELYVDRSRARSRSRDSSDHRRRNSVDILPNLPRRQLLDERPVPRLLTRRPA